MNTNPIIIDSHIDIGRNSAEHDKKFLSKCFVKHPALEELKDFESSKIIALGRTGSGKTALIIKILEEMKNCTELSLSGMSLNYITNSTGINFLQTLGVDLDLFFQSLWKHVICLEIIRVNFSVKSEDKSKTIFQNLFERFNRDQKKQTAIKYLEDWESKFWLPMERNVQEVTTKLENQLENELGTHISKFSERAGYIRTLSSERKIQLQNRAKKFVSSEQLSQLNRVIEILSEYSIDKYKKCFIVIDKIDENWVDDSLRFKLIKALIESFKEFDKLNNFKIVVAMRSDVLQRVIAETQELGFQSEKYYDFINYVNWDKQNLKELVDKRISYYCKKKYTIDNVVFEDIFRGDINDQNIFDYLLDRTLYRPRDIISFINICLNKAKGKTEVTPSHVKEAEKEYSDTRFRALVEEWKSTFPKLEDMLNCLHSCHHRLEGSHFLNDRFFGNLIELMYNGDFNEIDPIQIAVKKYVENSGDELRTKVICIFVEILYRVGFWGLKKRSDKYFNYSHINKTLIRVNPTEINTCKVHIHPMFHRYLDVKTSR